MFKTFEKIEDEENFDKSILNAPKLKFKVAGTEPTPFVLEEVEEEKEYTKIKYDLTKNETNFSSSSDNEEYDNDSFEESNNFTHKENGKIYLSLINPKKGSTN